MARIKRALDPDNIMNPDKVLQDGAVAAAEKPR
jgi:hypothetical protein